MGVVATRTERFNSHGIISSLSSRSSLCPEGLQVRITLTDDKGFESAPKPIDLQVQVNTCGIRNIKILRIHSVSNKMSINRELQMRTVKRIVETSKIIALQ